VMGRRSGWVVDGLSLGGVGEDETLGRVHKGRFSLDDTCFQTAPFFYVICYHVYCYILYIIC
jgi:hypothetical protein